MHRVPRRASRGGPDPLDRGRHRRRRHGQADPRQRPDPRGLPRRRAKPPWPTLRELIDRDERVLVLIENDPGDEPWMHQQSEVAQETPYRFDDRGRAGGADDVRAQPRRHGGLAAARQPLGRHVAGAAQDDRARGQRPRLPRRRGSRAAARSAGMLPNDRRRRLLPPGRRAAASSTSSTACAERTKGVRPLLCRASVASRPGDGHGQAAGHGGCAVLRAGRRGARSRHGRSGQPAALRRRRGRPRRVGEAARAAAVRPDAHDAAAHRADERPHPAARRLRREPRPAATRSSTCSTARAAAPRTGRRARARRRTPPRGCRSSP